jgi:hypothetical protein
MDCDTAMEDIAAVAAAKAASLSEYQIARARKIERNNAKLEALGLISSAEATVSNAVAWGQAIRETKGALAKDAVKHEGGNIKSKKRERAKDDPKDATEDSERLPRRSSQRLRGIKPQYESGDVSTLPTQNRQRHIWTLSEVDDVGRSEGTDAETRPSSSSRENPTATYAHCLHRVRTMTEKQLQNRIRVIERAQGAHCIIKLSIMARCCRDEGHIELSELATAALERLQSVLLSSDST